MVNQHISHLHNLVAFFASCDNNSANHDNNFVNHDNNFVNHDNNFAGRGNSFSLLLTIRPG